MDQPRASHQLNPALERGLSILNFNKTPLICSVSNFNLGGLELCLGEVSPSRPPLITYEKIQDCKMLVSSCVTYNYRVLMSS